jgi:transcriptional regulator GlxA family with amidase domain
MAAIVWPAGQRDHWHECHSSIDSGLVRTVAVLAFDRVIGFELGIPCEVFGAAGRRADRPDDRSGLYDVRVCGPSRRLATNGYGDQVFGITPPHPLAAAEDVDTIVVPGVTRYEDPVPGPVLDLLRRAHARGARIASVCTGAFVLAAAGLLDGLRATTHWATAEDLACSYPLVRVDPAVLYVDSGNILTSAGMAAGLDMCLHIVRHDYGAAVAADAARSVVMPLERDGGQAQFIAHPDPISADTGLQPTLSWMQDNLDRPLALADIARHARLGVRTLSRRFREQTGSTPVQWLIRQRLHQAQQYLETTTMPVEEVARRSGFGTAVVLRQHFARHLGTSPLAYRRAFQPPA